MQPLKIKCFEKLETRKLLSNRKIKLDFADTKLKIKKNNRKKPFVSKETFSIDLARAKKLIWKILLELDLEPEDLRVSLREKQIVEAFLKKKKYVLPENFAMSREHMEWVLSQKLKKKVENELKFVLTRSIKHLQKKFKNEHLIKKGDSENSSKGNRKKMKRSLNHEFYQMYFQEIADREELPIEKFYHFQGWNKKRSANMHKSITRESLRLWKKSPLFISEIKKYIFGDLEKEVRKSLKKKFQKIMDKWEYFIMFYGEEDGFVEIMEWFNIKGRKLPWNNSEINFAIATTVKHLS